jgi:hypothetical protein
MADSTIATKEVENWIRNEFLPKKYHQAFTKHKLGVQSGGEFECENNNPPAFGFPPSYEGGSKGGSKNHVKGL